MNVTCEIDNLAEVARTWIAVKREMGAGCVRGVDRGIREAVAEARATHTFKNRTGVLERSIGGGLETTQQAGAVGEMHATAPYASFVEDDTRAHEIRPVRAPLLSWVGGDGVRRFARIVHHHGTKGQPFMGPAYLKIERVVEREVEAASYLAQGEIRRG